MKRMAAVRKQVDVGAMADPAYRKAAEENDLQTDLFPGAGNVPFHDPKVVITLDGGTKEAVDNSTPPVKEPVPTSTREEIADMPAPDTEYGEDDLFVNQDTSEEDAVIEDGKALFATGIQNEDGIPIFSVIQDTGKFGLFVDYDSLTNYVLTSCKPWLH